MTFMEAIKAAAQDCVNFENFKIWIMIFAICGYVFFGMFIIVLIASFTHPIVGLMITLPFIIGVFFFAEFCETVRKTWGR